MNRNLLWLSANVNYQFRKQWTSVNDLQFRLEYSDGDLYQLAARSGITYKTGSGYQFTAGGAFFLHYPNPNGRVPRQEFRTWEEVSKKWEFGIHHSLYPRIRLEQRFFREYDGDVLADQFGFSSWRLRLRAEYAYSIGKENPRWSLIVGDEFMIQRKANGFTAMDQQRAWAGIAYKFSKLLSVQMIYLNVIQQRNSDLYDQLHVIRATIQFNFASKAATGS